MKRPHISVCLFILFITILLISCNSVLDKPYNESTLDKDAVKLKDEVDTTEAALLFGTILRYKFESRSLEGMTYRQLIDEGKKYKAEQERMEAEQKALAEKAKQEETERAKRLNEALTVSLFDKGFLELDYEEFITYKFAFQNKTPADMLGFTGTIIFTDLFDKEITKISITYDNGIKANSSVKWEATSDYNKFRDSDQTLRSKTLDKLKVVWKPEKVLFSDGSKLE